MNEINHEYYVSFEIAILLKKAGFNWKCWGCYSPKGKFQQIVYEWKPCIDDWNNMSCAKQCVSAPTIDVAQRWLREKKGYYVVWDFNMNINFCGQELYDFTDISVYIFVDSEQGNICKCKLKENFKTIESTQEAGVKKALELILKEEK